MDKIYTGYVQEVFEEWNRENIAKEFAKFFNRAIELNNSGRFARRNELDEFLSSMCLGYADHIIAWENHERHKYDDIEIKVSCDLQE